MKRLFACLLMLAFGLTGCKSVGQNPEDPMFVQLPMTAGQVHTDYEGVEIRLTGLQYYPDEGTTLFVTWDNKTEHDVIYGAAYTIERLDGEEWVSCAKQEELSFIEIAYELKAGRQTNKSYDLTNTYDVSIPGAYRFQTVCYVHENGESSVQCELTAEFTVDRDQSEVVKQTGESLEWCAQYIRTNGYQEGAAFPGVVIIESAQALTDYYIANRDTFDLERKDAVYADTTIGFLDACDQYDAHFFEHSYLVFVLLEEGSGSVRHEVRSVEQTAGGKLAVSIDTRVPEVGTADMAQWHIMLELSRDALAEKAEDVLVYLDGNLRWNGSVAEPPKPETAFKEPPALTLHTPDGELVIKAAGYNWTYENSDGTAVSTIADQAGRPIEQRFLEQVVIDSKYAESIYAYVPKTGSYEPINSAGVLVKLNWQAAPTSVDFTCWDDAVWSTENVQEQQVFDWEDGAFYGYLGGYVYEITATWEDTGAGWYGSANYYVYIAVNAADEP